MIRPLRFGVLPCLLAAALAARADIVTMKDGRTFEGEVVEDDGTSVKLKLKKGAVTLKHADIASIEKKQTPAEEYRGRVAKADAKNAAAQRDLGLWAAENGLAAEAGAHLAAAWELEPGMEGVAEALEGLDWHQVDGRWQGPDTYWPARGWVKHGTRWISPAEHAWRKAVEDLAAKKAARDEAAAASPDDAAKLRKIDTRIREEQAGVAAAEAALAKAQAAGAAAQKKFSAAEAKVKAAADRLASIQAKEKPKEGEAGKPPSAAEEDAQKKLLAASEAAAKESKALAAAKSAAAEQEKKLAEIDRNVAALEKEKAAILKASGTSTPEARKAQAEFEDAEARAAELKAAWEEEKAAAKEDAIGR